MLRSSSLNGSSGGSIAFILRDAFCNSTSFKRLSFQSFEAVELHNLFGRNLSVSVVCLYKTLSQQKGPTLHFFSSLSLQEFPQFLTHFADSHSDLALPGDLNLHYDDCAYSQVNRLQIALK